MSIPRVVAVLVVALVLGAPSIRADHVVEGDPGALVVDLGWVEIVAGLQVAPSVEVDAPVSGSLPAGSSPYTAYVVQAVADATGRSDEPTPEDHADAHDAHGHESHAHDEHAAGAASGPSAPPPSTLCGPSPTTARLDLVGILPRVCIPLLVDPTPLVTALPVDLGIVPAASPDDGAGGVVETSSVDVGPAPPAPSVATASSPLVTLAGVAAVAAASSAAPAAGPLLERLRRFGWLALAPLYTRLSRDSILAHETRDALFAALREKPGSAIADLAEAASIPRNTATHHLHMLERQGLVSSTRKGRVRLYFPVGSAAERRSAEAIAILRHDTTAHVARRIGLEPGVDQAALCAAVGVAPSLAHWHVSRLVQAGLVTQVRDGRRVRYYPGDSFHLVASEPSLTPGT